VLDVHPRTTAKPAGALANALPRIRLAAPFERLRDASDAALAKTGARPKIFLANLGRPADFIPRATYAKDFFETGGIEAVTNEGFAAARSSNGEANTDLAALTAAFKESGAKLACLCSSDEVYAREAESAAKALSAAEEAHIYLAGRPRELEQPLQKAGVSTFIYVGCDVLATLNAAHDILKIER
jgi:methylmalonyl-CoA mutase